jgi:signal transduction histidine kinase
MQSSAEALLRSVGTHRVRRRMILAFVLLALMAVLGGSLVAYQMFIGLRTPIERARDAERKVLHAAEIGRHSASIAAGLYRGTLEPLSPELIAEIEERMQRIGLHLADIGPLVTDEQDLYAQALPLFARAHRVIAGALEAGDTDRATYGQELNAQLVPILSEARVLTEEMIARNRAEAATQLHRSNDRMRLVLWATLAWTCLFILLIAAAGCYTVRIVRRQQRQIGDQMKRLELAIRDLDAFAGRIAHDLRGPLAPILLAGEHLQRNVDLPGVGRSADRIVRAARRADELIESLLAFSRAGEARPGRCDAARATARALEETLDAADQAAIDLRTEVAPVEVAIEEPLLAQSLQNLIGNAIRYMPDDATDRRITVRSHRTDGEVRFTVADTGRGIPPADRESVFRPFYRRADNAQAPGTGLGLATVRRIVEAHRGSVGIRDNPGGGALLWFTVPTAPPAAEQPHPAPLISEPA